jgi:hypothetical protein
MARSSKKNQDTKMVRKKVRRILEKNLRKNRELLERLAKI